MTRERALHRTLMGAWEDGTRPKDLYAGKIAKRPAAHVDAVLEGLESEEARVRNGCAELASLLSADRPELLLPHFDLFERNLRAKAPMLRWEAACTVGNLAAVAAPADLARTVPMLKKHLADKSVVLQGHCVRALGKIAAADAAQAPKILSALTGAADRFPGSRVGYLVEAMLAFAANPKLAPRVRKFVTPYVGHKVRAVDSKAKRVVKALDRAAQAG